MKNKKWIALAAAVVLAVTALPMGVFAAKKDSTEEKLTKVTLNEVAHSIFYAPQYVAIEEGYFKDEGLDLTLVTGFGADKTMTAVISGEADIGFLGTGNHDRSAVILDQIRQSSSCICHSVRSMAKHKAIIKFIFGFDQSGQLQPMVCTHIGTVQGKRLNGINGAEFPGFRNIFQQLICGNLRCQPLCCIFGSNGSPGCNKKYLFHVVPLCNCYPHVQSAVPAFSETLLCSEKLFS